MSYESVPVERRDVYLAAAEQACDVALQESLGDQAEQFLAAWRDTDTFADAVVDYVNENDMQSRLRASLEQPIDSGIIGGAEYHLEQHNQSFAASGFNQPVERTHQSADERTATIAEIQDLLAQGDADELYGLTIDKQTANHRVNESGSSQYQTDNGIWLDESVIDSAQIRWDANPAAHQMAAWFMQRKAPNRTEPGQQ